MKVSCSIIGFYMLVVIHADLWSLDQIFCRLRKFVDFCSKFFLSVYIRPRDYLLWLVMGMCFSFCS